MGDKKGGHESLFSPHVQHLLRSVSCVGLVFFPVVQAVRTKTVVLPLVAIFDGIPFSLWFHMISIIQILQVDNVVELGSGVGAEAPTYYSIISAM